MRKSCEFVRMYGIVHEFLSEETDECMVKGIRQGWSNINSVSLYLFHLDLDDAWENGHALSNQL